MSLKNFRAYQLALKFHRSCLKCDCPEYLREQFDTATSSIVLNLAEGCAKPTPRDRRKFYYIALGSLRESQSILEILAINNASELAKIADHLGATIYKL